MNNIKFFKFIHETDRKGYDGATITSHEETIVAIDAIACIRHDVTRYSYSEEKKKDAESFVIELKNGSEISIDSDQHDALEKILMFA